MKRKIIKVGPEARRAVIAGAKFAADKVKITLGPYGRNFVSGIVGGPVRISNDGVSLLKLIEGKDEIEDLGVRAIREASTKVNEEAGDGTTSVAVLAYAILQKIAPNDDDTVRVKNAGTVKTSTTSLISDIKRETKVVVEKLKEMAVEVQSREELVDVAFVSVEDRELAEMIGGAQWDVGKFGTVITEIAMSKEDTVEHIHGVRIDNGYTTSRIINNQEARALELHNVHVILTNKIFNQNLDPIKHILQGLGQKGVTQVVVVGRAFDDGAIGFCVRNIQQEGAMDIFPINAPYTDQNEVMEDIATVIGARYINVDERNPETMIVGDVGIATKIMARQLEGMITGRKPGEDEKVDERVAKRVKTLEEKLDSKELSPFERRHIESRLAQMRGGTAIIKVGAETDQERSRKKDKVEDAVNAVRAAMQEGVVEGGGQALAIIAEQLPHDALLREPLCAIYNQIIELAPPGFEIASWVKDPVKVVRICVEKACEIASSLATTEAAINWEREKPQYVTSVDSKIGEAEE